MDRKAGELWNDLTPDSWWTAVAMAALSRAGEDTSTPAIEEFLGSAVSKQVPPLMAHVKRNADWIDGASPRKPRMIESTTHYGGLVRHLFAETASDAILRRLFSSKADSLIPGATYTWAELAELFDFDVGYLSRAGGMPILAAHDCVLAITHPDGGRSFDYEDYWDGGDLVYTGRGRIGNQQLKGANRDLADNRRRILVFEAEDSAELKFCGSARCIEFWPDTGLDLHGERRRIYRFRLRFLRKARVKGNGDLRGARPPRRVPPASAGRRSRPFDPSRELEPAAAPGFRTTPEETAAQHEKARQGHLDALRRLARILIASGWTEPHEYPFAIDLYASPPNEALHRVLFEVKTLRPGAELQRTRAALAQLLEYRLLWGKPDDDLCVVTTAPISENRVRLLRTLGVDVAWLDRDKLRTTGICVSRSVANLVTL